VIQNDENFKVIRTVRSAVHSNATTGDLPLYPAHFLLYTLLYHSKPYDDFLS